MLPDRGNALQKRVTKMRECGRSKSFSGKPFKGAAAAGAGVLRPFAWIVLALTVMNPAACEQETKDAPGCAPGIGCGGCMGKKAIRDFVYEGPDCFHAGANDCTSILLEMHNNCASEAQIGGQTIPADGTYRGFSVVKLPDGSFALGSSTLSTAPSDETVTLTGTVGAETVTITMFVTGEQC